MEFCLYRLKVYLSKQINLFEELREGKRHLPSYILRQALLQLPHEPADENLYPCWHIGNIEPIDDESLYFKIGRTSRKKDPDFVDGQFIIKETSTSPFTHAVIDTTFEVCAIGQNAELGKTTDNAANHLCKLLTTSSVIRKYGAEVEIASIKNPNEFIHQLMEAESITKFWFTVSRPNPMDQDEDIIGPLERFMQRANSRKTRVNTDGETLTREGLTPIIHHTAATGNDAGATINTPDVKGKKIRRLAAGTPVSFTSGNLEDADEQDKAVGFLRQFYEKVIRSNGEDRTT